jgi:hypothetical protein
MVEYVLVFPVCDSLSSLKELQQEIHLLTFIIWKGTQCTTKWNVHEMVTCCWSTPKQSLKKFITQIPLRIELSKYLLKCFTAGRQKSPHKSTKILQFTVSGKQKIVTCFSLSCSAFMMPSVGKNNGIFYFFYFGKINVNTKMA